ncbi:MAG: TonB family protein [Rudaea sp.]|uniref:energy transducer TonB n=1 Tax=Rudaea sp. TaxID=2136325 RepID=UPI0039E35078
MPIAGRILSQHSRTSLLLAYALVAACHQAVRPVDTPPETRVAYRAVATPGEARYEEKNDEENYSTPTLLDTPSPQYPPGLIAQHLPPVFVRAKLIVDKQGKVGEVRVQPDGSRAPEFDSAVRGAVSHWRYSPLRHVAWKEVKDAEGSITDSQQTLDETLPFSLDYEFRFELRDGKPVVGSATLHE